MLRYCVLSLLSVAACVQASEFTTFIGAAAPLQVVRVASDSAGNTYVLSVRSQSALITKLDPAGNIILFRNISGRGAEAPKDIAIDAAGNIYVAGATASTDFPVRNAMQSTPGPGFLAKLSADGTQLIWSTYFRETISALAVDTSGNVYITGSTEDSTFPVTAGLPGPGGVSRGLGEVAGAYLTKISAAGDRILYSAVIAGHAKDCTGGSSCFLSSRTTAGVSVSVDPSGNAYLAGNTDTTNLPTTAGSFLQTGVGPFVARVKADGTGLVYLTYVASGHVSSTSSVSPDSIAVAVTSDPAGNAYLTGETSDLQFPATPGAFQPVYGGPPQPNQFSFPQLGDAFALKLKPDGTGLVWATYLGGPGQEIVNATSLDSAGQLWIAGTTASPNFPNAQGWSGGRDFISGLNATGTQLTYSARYPDNGAAQAISADSNGVLHIAGPTGIVSTIIPGAPPTPRIWGVANAANGPIGGVLSAGEVISIYGPHIGPATPVITGPDNTGNLPTSIPGYQLITNLGFGATPQLLYLGDSQINAVIPFGAYGQGPIHINTPNGPTPDFPLIVVPARPEIFRKADNSAIAVNQDGTLNSQSNAASFGSFVAIYATGIDHPVRGNSGQIATGANNSYSAEVETASGFLPVTYSGDAPGAVLGVSQINFQIPQYGGPPATLPINLLTRDGSMSLPVLLYVH